MERACVLHPDIHNKETRRAPEHALAEAVSLAHALKLDIGFADVVNLRKPQVGLLFVIPGFDETLRVNGTASLSTDPDLLAQMAVNGRVPKLAIVVRIETLFIHCAKAFRRGHMWDPAQFQDRKEMPSLVQIVLEQTTGAPSDPDVMRELDEGLENAYKTTMY